MSKAKILGYYKPFTPNAKVGGKHGKKAPWQGGKQKTTAATEKKEVRK